MFAAEYESFLIDDELEYDVLEFDDLCSATDCLLANASKSISKFVSLVPALELKPVPASSQYSFLGPYKSFPIIIAYKLDPDQENKWIASLTENEEAMGLTLGEIKSISPYIVQHRIHLDDNAKPY